MAEREIIVKHNISVCGIKISNTFPFIDFHFLAEEYTIEEDTYHYKTRTFWFMVAGAILPLIFKSIPFNWAVGIAVGFGVGMVYNIVRWILFRVLMKYFTKNHG